jgi:hypothetical protein
MKSLFKFWLILLIPILLSPFMITRGYAQSAILYPAHGTVNTEVFLQVRGIGGTLYLFWDDILFDTYTANVQDFPGFDIYFHPPNEHPYSDLGNHTVFLHVWWKYWDGHDYYVEWNCTLTFKITEQPPCQEYLALNATYYDLLADYNALNDDYNALQAQHNELTDSHEELLADYNTKLANYSSLSGSYNSLCTNYDALQTNYDSLHSNYDSLQSNSEQMAINYGNLTNELTAARTLGYVLLITTMILVGTTLYTAVRKPKQKPT